MKVTIRGRPDRVERWNDLRAEWSTCRRCRLAACRARVVFGEGDLDARLAIVGEAPGADEDRLGRPFVGRSGKALRRWLRLWGVDPAEVLIVNLVACRPPNNRDPEADEIRACRPRLESILGLTEVSALLLLGKVPLARLTGARGSMKQWRGQILDAEFGSFTLPAVATYHPAHWLRQFEEARYMRRVADDVRLATEVSRAGIT